MPQPTPQEQIAIREGIQSGRDGSATLVVLARAHEAAARHNMTETVKELRRHIYNLLPHPGPPPISKRGIFYSVLTGLITGTIITFIYAKTRLHERLGLK